MNIGSAHAFLSPIARAYRVLDASVAETFRHNQADPAHLYQRALDGVMAEIVWHAFMPVFHEHPDLERLYLSSTTSDPSSQPEAVSLAAISGYIRGCLAAAEGALPSVTDPAERTWYLSGLSQNQQGHRITARAINALSATGPSQSA